ncbi:hypothetical protein EVAR_50999_1 [Eumeta japonica]|uniref:Uncharacterized protein n=1 Tax=Eumeta variegata TaxID=151549 RepID=A0A4C1ZXR5_EUMVA|nr:hypothetical protein EVAR_50999_1 [Eumeta japonica]
MKIYAAARRPCTWTLFFLSGNPHVIPDRNLVLSAAARRKRPVCNGPARSEGQRARRSRADLRLTKGNEIVAGDFHIDFNTSSSKLSVARNEPIVPLLHARCYVTQLDGRRREGSTLMDVH